MESLSPVKPARRNMKSGLKTTFQYLKKTENEAAVEVLIECLDSKLDAVRAESLRALLDRPSPAGHRAVLARLSQFNQSDLEIVAERPDRMARAISDAINYRRHGRLHEGLWTRFSRFASTTSCPP